MADLDTRSKRASSVGFWKPYAMALVLPDGAIGQGDRQHSVWDYAGILASALVVIAFTTPDGRTYNVPYQDRALEVPYQDRILEVRE